MHQIMIMMMDMMMAVKQPSSDYGISMPIHLSVSLGRSCAISLCIIYFQNDRIMTVVVGNR
jgi:hypothetical protein